MSAKFSPILPGSTLGVLGSGQLGRMFAIAARRMGYRVHTLSPDEDTPTGQVADLEINAHYDDIEAVAEFSKNVDVVTFEFENVPAATAEAAARHAPVRPGGEVLHITQHRLREKNFLSNAGFPVAPYRHVRRTSELRAALVELGCPAILKTAGFGYDGKGQSVVRSEEEAVAAWRTLGSSDAVLEGFIDFDCEVSVVAARGHNGEFVHYGTVLNEHKDHILDVTTAPSGLGSAQNREAIEIARGVVDVLGVVGVLCVEFFVTKSGKLLVNELAPRPHNSGHFTVDACATSQFEQQLRAVCGLPLGSTEMHRPAAMANLLGDVWAGGEPNWVEACSFPEVKLHLYGKGEPRPGRKMGHLTALGGSAGEASNTVRAARHSLLRRV